MLKKVYILAKNRKMYKRAMKEHKLSALECVFVTRTTDLYNMDPKKQRLLLYRDFDQNPKYQTERFQYVFGFVVENANLLPMDSDDEFNTELRNGADPKKLAELANRGGNLMQDMEKFTE
jgi:hypothetical protein